MSSALFGILSLIGLVAAYLALVWVGRHFFSGRYRAETAAAAVVVAFTIGFNISHPDSRPAAQANGAAAMLPVVPSATAAAASGGALADISSRCNSVHLSGAKGKGHIDTATVQRGTEVHSVGTAPLQRGEYLILSGWAADPTAKDRATSVCLLLDGKMLRDAKVLYGNDRPDVATAFASSALTATGFAISLPAERIGAGRHRLQAVAAGADGSAALLPGDVDIAGSPHPGKS